MKFETMSTKIGTIFRLELTLTTLILYTIVVFQLDVLLKIQLRFGTK